MSERGQFRLSLIFSVAAFLISASSAYFAYLNSPRSDAYKPKIYFHSKNNIALSPNGEETAAMIGCIENRSGNPGENLLVTIMTLAEQPEPPTIRVQNGIEYSMLEHHSGLTTLKFPTFPAHFKCNVFVERYKVNPALQAKLKCPVITEVVDRFGDGRGDATMPLLPGFGEERF